MRRWEGEWAVVPLAPGCNAQRSVDARGGGGDDISGAEDERACLKQRAGLERERRLVEVAEAFAGDRGDECDLRFAGFNANGAR
jgi:hypothetical protein